MSKVVGDKIRNIRLGGNKHNKVYNQKEFADEIGATLQAVSNWENNRNKPNSYRLRALAELGEITVDELLRGDCQLCTGREFKASWYAAVNFELDVEYAVTEDRKIFIPILNSRAEYLGFLDIDINYCPECGRKLEVKQ